MSFSNLIFNYFELKLKHSQRKKQRLYFCFILHSVHTAPDYCGLSQSSVAFIFASSNNQTRIRIKIQCKTVHIIENKQKKIAFSDHSFLFMCSFYSESSFVIHSCHILKININCWRPTKYPSHMRKYSMNIIIVTLCVCQLPFPTNSFISAILIFTKPLAFVSFAEIFRIHSRSERHYLNFIFLGFHFTSVWMCLNTVTCID